MAYKKTTRFNKGFKIITDKKVIIEIEDIDDCYIVSTLFRLPTNKIEANTALFQAYRANMDEWCRNSKQLMFDKVKYHIFILELPEKNMQDKKNVRASKIKTEYYMYPQNKTSLKIDKEEILAGVMGAMDVYDGLEFIDKKERVYKSTKKK